jgi:hypothetical protein
LINQSAAKSFRWCPAVGQPFWKIHRFSSLLHKQTEEAASRERRGGERRGERRQHRWYVWDMVLLLMAAYDLLL